MPVSFSPTQADVARYTRLRALSKDLNHKIVKTVPPQAYTDIGRAIGILHDGVLVFGSMDMSHVLMDCCLYDWVKDGKNVMQRYVGSHPASQGTDQRCLFDAYLQAKYRILVSQSVAPGAGLYCLDILDILNKEELFIMDVGLSRSVPGANHVFASRTIPLGEYWMTTGAGLPIHSKKTVQAAISRPGEKQLPLPLAIVRACLAAGAADYVAYEDVEI
jgi:hypothetical protein